MKYSYLESYGSLFRETRNLAVWYTKLFEPSEQERADFTKAPDFYSYLPKSSDPLVTNEAAFSFWVRDFSMFLASMQQEAAFNHDVDGVIGDGDNLVTELPADMAIFRKLTAKSSILMGMHTYLSLRKPLESEAKVGGEVNAAKTESAKTEAAKAESAKAEAAKVDEDSSQPQDFGLTPITDETTRAGWVKPGALPQLQPVDQFGFVVKNANGEADKAGASADAKAEAKKENVRAPLKCEQYAKPLPGRLNLVMSRSAAAYYQPDAYLAQEEGFSVTPEWTEKLAVCGLPSAADVLLFVKHVQPAKRLFFVSSQVQALIVTSLVLLYDSFLKSTQVHKQNLNKQMIGDILEKDLGRDQEAPRVKDPCRFLSTEAAKGLKKLHANLCDKEGKFVLTEAKRLCLIGGADVFNQVVGRYFAHPLARLHLLYLTQVKASYKDMLSKGQGNVQGTATAMESLPTLDLKLIKALYQQQNSSALFVGNPEAPAEQQLQCQFTLWAFADAQARTYPHYTGPVTATPKSLLKPSPVALEFCQ